MDTLQLSTDVLGWAASQVGSSLDDLALKISKRSAGRIVKGELSQAQVLKFAKAAGVPLGYLFLEEPPHQRQLPLVDFRTTAHASPLSKDFFETYDDIEFKQAWYKELLIGSDATPLVFIGKYAAHRPTVEELAVEIRNVVGFSEETLRSVKTPDELFGALSLKIEARGILVFKNGVVGNSNHRPLLVSEFRGFAIADEFAPVIFINGADAPAAWVFTLAHELAHLWLGDSGISDADPASNNGTEQYCNAVAAEFLVPQVRFLHFWENNSDITVAGTIDDARRHFKVSALVIARRALDLGFISKHDYADVYSRARRNAKAEPGGGDYYRTLAVRNGKRFSKRVAAMAVSGNITLGQAGRLLNANPNKVVTLYEKQNAISI